jgi:hypothetical protein
MRLQVVVMIDKMFGFRQENNDLLPPTVDERAAYSLNGGCRNDYNAEQGRDDQDQKLGGQLHVNAPVC